MKQKPLVNVIIPTYTSQRFWMLKEAVQSVQNQTYGQENISIIIAINGSDLAHKKAVENTYAGIKNITCLYTAKSNVPTAFNNAIRHLTEGYMTILDDDDYLTKGYIEELCSHAEPDVDIVFGRQSNLRKDGSIDYDSYINGVLRNVGAGKQIKSAKGAHLLNAYASYLFNVPTVKNKFEPFDETLDFMFDTVYMLTNFGHIDRYVYVLPANGWETYVVRKTENSLCRPSKEKEFIYWISGRTKVLEKLTDIVFKTKDNEHLQAAINHNLDAAYSMYSYYLSLSAIEQQRALKYVNECQSFFLDKEKFNAQLKINNLQKDCERLQQEIIALRNNRSFKLGRYITFVPRKIRGAIRCYNGAGFKGVISLAKQRIRELKK